MSATKIQPTFHGYIGSTKDALLVIQQALNKQVELVPRRPQEKERPHLIQSGNVFVFIEEHSGIKRWTDGTAWSPSRILGRFLVYRELDKNTKDDKDDKKKKKRKTSTSSVGANNSNSQEQLVDPLDSQRRTPPLQALQLLHPLPRSEVSIHHGGQEQQHHIQQHQHQQLQQHQQLLSLYPQSMIPANSIPAANAYGNSNTTDYQKSLLSGPLVTSYVFKDQGLIKKTLSLTTKTKALNLHGRDEKQTVHLISYYNAQEVMNGKLQRPSESDYRNVQISPALWNAVKDSSLGGKVPIEDEAFYFLDNNYQLQNMSSMQPPMPSTLPTSVGNSADYFSQKQGYNRFNQSLLLQPQYHAPPQNPNQHPQQLLLYQQQQQQQLHQRQGSPQYFANETQLIKREDDNSGDVNFINPFGNHQQNTGGNGYPFNNTTAHNHNPYFVHGQHQLQQQQVLLQQQQHNHHHHQNQQQQQPHLPPHGPSQFSSSNQIPQQPQFNQFVQPNFQPPVGSHTQDIYQTHYQPQQYNVQNQAPILAVPTPMPQGQPNHSLQYGSIGSTSTSTSSSDHYPHGTSVSSAGSGGPIQHSGSIGTSMSGAPTLGSSASSIPTVSSAGTSISGSNRKLSHFNSSSSGKIPTTSTLAHSNSFGGAGSVSGAGIGTGNNAGNNWFGNNSAGSIPTISEGFSHQTTPAPNALNSGTSSIGDLNSSSTSIVPSVAPNQNSQHDSQLAHSHQVGGNNAYPPRQPHHQQQGHNQTIYTSASSLPPQQQKWTGGFNAPQPAPPRPPLHLPLLLLLQQQHQHQHQYQNQPPSSAAGSAPNHQSPDTVGVAANASAGGLLRPIASEPNGASSGSYFPST